MSRGHLVKRSKSTWTGVVDEGRDPMTGKRRQRWFTVKGTKKDAEMKLAEGLHEIYKGEFLKPSRLTVQGFLGQWLHDYAWPNLAPRTAEGYEHIVKRHLIPSLGSLLLTELRPEHLQRYYSDKLKAGRLDDNGGLSPKTVRHHHVTLHDALQFAVKWRILGRNPADAVDPPGYQSHEMRTLDEDALCRFLHAAQATPYYCLFYLALFTGMRRSELLGLRWTDVDLDQSQVSVTRGLHHLRDGSTSFRAPKTSKGRRQVPLPPSATVVLRKHHESCESDAVLTGRNLQDTDLVFSKPDGAPLLPDTVTHAWLKLARRCGLRGVRLHDARHTHASLMLKAGIHPKVVQERLGHANIQATLDTYSHVTPGLQAAAAKRFDEGLGISESDPVLAETVKIY